MQNTKTEGRRWRRHMRVFPPTRRSASYRFKSLNQLKITRRAANEKTLCRNTFFTDIDNNVIVNLINLTLKPYIYNIKCVLLRHIRGLTHNNDQPPRQ